MGERYIRKKFPDCYMRKHGRTQNIYSIPKVGDVIVVNEHPMRWANPYIKCDEEHPLLMTPNDRFIGKVVMMTDCLLIIEVCNARGVRERALRLDDIRLAFYKYAVVEEDCLYHNWSRGDLDLNGDKVLYNIIQMQELVEVKQIF